MNDYECRDCKMRFESSEQLANHVKRFCINSDYGDLNRLDKKYDSAIRNPYPEMKPTANQKDPSQLKNYGAYTLDQIKSNLKSQDDDFKKLENAVLRKREDEMLEEIDKLKQDRQQMRVVTEQDEQIYQSLLTEVDLKKEREFQCRIEKEQIRKVLNEIDTWKISVMDEQKKFHLERLLNDREALKVKQLQLIEDIRAFTRGHRTFQSLEQAQKLTDNRQITSAQYSEAKQQLVKLHTRLEYLEIERNKILDNLERLRLGDMGELRRSNLSGQSERNYRMMVEPEKPDPSNYEDIARMKDKIAKDTQRLEQLKRDQMERVEKLRPQTNYSDKIVDELQQLKQDYKNAGGNDPRYQKDVENLEQFYKGALNKSNHSMRQPTPAQNVEPPPPMQPIQQFVVPIQQPTPGEFIKPQKKKRKDFNDPFDSFSRKKEFFLQNNVRGVDLTREELILMNLQAQEVDALRMISRIPVGTEIYRFKMEQYKELSTMRAEMEKIMQEQRLQKLRRNFEKKRRVQDREFENNKWVDDQRKFIIDNRLKEDFSEVRPQSHLYDPAEGFVVHWDYCLGLPRRTKLCQFVYAVFNNMQSLYSPKLIEPMDCEIESEQTNRVLIGDSNQLQEIPAHFETLLIIEVQFPPSKKLEDNVGKTESHAWTQLDLFDQQGQLKRGKFKCPLYVGPTDPTITIDEIGKLEPIPNAWFHLRITYPNDEDFGQVRSIYPEQTAAEYNIPYIHLRGLFARNYEAATQGKLPDKKDNGDVTIGGQNYKLTEEVQVFNNGRKATPQTRNYPLRANAKKGLRVVLHQISGHVANHHLRVMCACIMDQNLLFDQAGSPLTFNSTIHDPNSAIPGMGNENDPLPLVMADPQYQGLSNKAAKSILISFHEEFRFFYDFPDMALKSRKPIYLGFQITEKSGSQQGKPNDSMTFVDYDVIGWVFIELVSSDGSLRVGRNSINMYNPPMRRPPLDTAQLTQSGIRLDYSIYDFEYTDEDILQWRNSKRF